MKTRRLSTKVARFACGPAEVRPLTHFAQWNHTRRGADRWGSYVRSSFTTIVRRPGQHGWWVLKPYYCYSGPRSLRFRRLPAMLTLRLRVAFMCRAVDAMLRSAWHSMRSAALRLVRRLDPIAAYQRWSYRREMRKWGLDA